MRVSANLRKGKTSNQMLRFCCLRAKMCDLHYVCVVATKWRLPVCLLAALSFNGLLNVLDTGQFSFTNKPILMSPSLVLRNEPRRLYSTHEMKGALARAGVRLRLLRRHLSLQRLHWTAPATPPEGSAPLFTPLSHSQCLQGLRRRQKNNNNGEGKQSEIKLSWEPECACMRPTKCT